MRIFRSPCLVVLLLQEDLLSQVPVLLGGYMIIIGFNAPKSQSI